MEKPSWTQLRFYTGLTRTLGAQPRAASLTWQLPLTVADEAALEYAILSHTWDDGEVLLEDLQDISQAKKKAGYAKIQFCCDEAERDGLEYVWIDTCCFEKSSSAELSEVINSMYRWYQNARVCYAYLSDVHDNDRRTIAN